ncbi:MAG TPA: peptide deformylase [Candidatus Saccharimonadales bacterium]|nr:peptide deformylase [Candidatus Saccharimonadales bacterium]
MSMTKDDVIVLPHKNLRERSQKVGIITPQVHQMIEDMKSATISWEQSRDHEVGVALAAVQVNHLYRIVVIRNNYDNKDDLTFTTFINPVITKLEGDIEEDYEGCLSVKDIYGKVPRYTRVRVKALDEQGKEFRVTAEGFLARIFQHEIDHTNGILFVDHIKGNTNAFYRLKDDGVLQQLDYEKDIADNKALWS